MAAMNAVASEGLRRSRYALLVLAGCLCAPFGSGCSDDDTGNGAGGGAGGTGGAGGAAVGGSGAGGGAAGGSGASGGAGGSWCAEGLLVSDEQEKVIPSVAAPAYLESLVDEVFGTTVTRVTGDPGTPIPAVGGTWGTIERHHYSKDMAWNADMSLLLLDKSNGGHEDLYLDGFSYEVLFTRRRPGEARWDPNDSTRRIYVADDEIGWFDVSADTTGVLETFSGYLNLQFGPYEGNLSLDGSRIAVLATDPNGAQVAFAYDLTNQQKFDDIALSGVEVDWVSISPLGNYVVLNDGADHTTVFDLGGNPVGATWSEYGRPSHYDLTVDDLGDEVAVGVSKSDPDSGRVIKRRLEDGEVTVLTGAGYASHTSTRNLLRPGWAYVTYQGSGDSWPPYFDEIVAVKLDDSLTVERLVHHHGIKSVYEAEAHGSPSPDGTKVIFASNWDNDGGPIGAYVVDLCP